MTIAEAAEILTHPKKHWSHEIDDARGVACTVLELIVTRKEFSETRLRLQTFMDKENEE